MDGGLGSTDLGSCPAPLCRSLTDPSAYVRKTGVMGILKLYHLAPDMVKSSNMVDLLYNMIQDPDAQVRQERSHGVKVDIVLCILTSCCCSRVQMTEE